MITCANQQILDENKYDKLRVFQENLAEDFFVIPIKSDGQQILSVSNLL